jgi:hypothetical protein
MLNINKVKCVLLLVVTLGIYGFVGTMQNPIGSKNLGCPSGTRGNGKTMSLVKNGAMEYKQPNVIVFSNFKTVFSYSMSFYNMVMELNRNQEKYNKLKIVILLTELYNVLNPSDSQIKKKFYSLFLNQIRKFKATVYWDTQRFGDIAPTIRQNTNRVYMPYKVHDDGNICDDELCMKHHYVIIDQYLKNNQGEYVPAIDTIDSSIYGKMYNSLDNKPYPEPMETQVFVDALEELGIIQES